MRTLTPRLRSVVITAAAVAGLAGFGAAIAIVPTLARLGVGVVLCVSALVVLLHVLCGRYDVAERQRIMRWTMGSFALHAAVGAVIASSAAIVSYIGPDAFTYHSWAAERVARWNTGVAFADPRIAPGKGGFTQLLACFYWITTPTMVAGALMNAAFAAGIVPVLDRATKLLFDRERARAVPALVTLLPPFVVWSSQVLREAPILFFISVVILCAVSLRRGASVGASAALLAATMVLLELRGSLALPLLVVVLVAVALARRNITLGAVNAASITLLLSISIGLVGIGFGGYRYASDRDLADLSDFRRNTSQEATSGFDDETETETTSRAITYVVVGTPRLLLGPLPWSASSIRQMPAVLDAFVWWWCLYWAVRGLRRTRLAGSRRPLLTLLLPGATLTVILSLALGNYGLVVRQRPQVLVFLVPIIAYGLSTRSDARHPAAPAALVTASTA